MAEDEKQSMFGMTPDQFQALPEHIQTLLLSQNYTMAEAHHGNRRAEMSALEGQLWNVALTVIKTVLTINAGALVAILAFLASMVESDKTLWEWHLAASLISFTIGAALAVAAAFAAYFTGSAQAEALKAQEVKFTWPFIVDGSETKRQFDRSDQIRLIGIGLCVCSLLAAGLGCGVFLQFAAAAIADRETTKAAPANRSGLR